ncbi:MAG: helix-turn-helix transcriptional regulator [Fimbriimonadaceae bacterium]|nr:helix-turn-helix transcriptional regulator [Chitinophagales bacterium]
MYIETFKDIKGWQDRDTMNLIKKYSNENLILNCRSGISCNPLHADNLSLKITMKGREFYGVENKEIAVDPKRFFIVNAQQEHRSWVESEQYVEALTIYFAPKFVHNVYGSILTPEDKLLDDPFHLRNYPIYFFEQLYHFDEQMFHDMAVFRNRLENKLLSHEDQEQHLRYLLYHLLYIHRKDVVKEVEKMPAVKRSTKIEIYRRLHTAKDYIETFYTNNISLEELSGIATMSENQLLRHFKNTFHTTPHQYITNKRLEFAKGLLKNTRKPVGEIISMTGFEDVSSFGRLFKKHFAVTPAAYRNAC